MPRSKRPVMRDVAELAHVSQATVSYVLSGRSGGESRVSHKTRDRVLAAANELNYQPSFAARGLRTGSTGQICLISRWGNDATRWANSVWAPSVLHEMNIRGAEHQLVTVMVSAGDWIEYLGRNAADGAIVDLAGSDASLGPELARLAALGVSLTAVSDVIEPEGFDVVRSTERIATREAISSLIGAGYTDFACIRHFSDDDAGGWSNVRLTAFREALGRAQLPIREDWILATEGSWPRTLALTEQLLTGDPRPRAIVALDEQGCHSALWMARLLGLRVPEDVAVLGVGHGLVGAVTADGRAISVVTPSSANASADIVALLFQRMADPDLPGQIMTQSWNYTPGETT